MDFPKAIIKDIKRVEGTDIISCRLDSTAYKFPHKEQKWVDDDWLGFLLKDNVLFYGRWHKTENDVWDFVLLKQYDINLFQCGEVLDILDGYYGERAEIVLDKTRTWKQELYTNQENHDHCNVCWATIDTKSEKNFMKSDKNDVVCMKCFKEYVKINSLNFIHEV